MNRIVPAVFACLFAVSLSAQTVDLPYNPDSNADQIIGSPDLLDFLPTFGEPFVVGELMVDGMTLEQYLSELTDGVTMVGVELLSDTVLTFTFSNDSVVSIPFPGAIIGPQGPPGSQGDTGDDGANGADGATGPDGLSAYQIWLGLGNSGSEQDFIDNMIANFYAGVILGCSDPSACTYNSEATIDVPELCRYLDACGNCGGEGAIFECGCDGIPEGDCDCDGNQLDALGHCGGDCAADVDGDNICDDDDDCIGDYDACGVCQGPGEVFNCGCSDIPEGDCDCGGNQLDALGH
ncbi:MAG: collagen-like protein, partial [Flavobacteriales bacterium]|nr:collagen-like protein [Flavobacteriales bacterium]